MSEGNKNEKAGATTPATSSKVEGTQDAVKANAEIEKLKAENEDKIKKIESLETDLNDAKSRADELLKEADSEIASLKSENEKLKSALDKVIKKPKKGKGEKRFLVIDSFRDKDDDGKTYSIGDDVSSFDEDRLTDLVNRRLVTQS